MGLSKAEFRRKLHAGHGRAVTHLRDHGSAGLEEIVADACVRSRTFDRQCDDSRAFYLSLVLRHSGQTTLARDAVVARLGQPRRSPDASQGVELLRELAFQGDPIAWQWIEDNWKRWLAGGSTEVAAARLLWTREEGYREALESMPILWRRKRGQVTEGASVHLAAARLLGEERASAMQQMLVDRCPWLEKIGDFPIGWERSRAERTRATARTFEEFQAEPDVSPALWGRDAGEEEIRKAAERLTLSDDDAELTRLLRVFFRRKFPLAPEVLLRLTDHSARRVASRAYAALELLEDPVVRSFALSRLDDPEWGSQAIELLDANFEPGDEEVIQRRLMKVPRQDLDASHGFLMAGLNVLKRRPEVGAAVFSKVYEETPCSLCRQRAWDALQKVTTMDSPLVDEAQYDADSGTRKSARQYARSTGLPVAELPLASPLAADEGESSLP